MPLQLITAPTVEPITSAEVKLHLKVDVAADDTLITTLITAVRERAETATGRAMCTQTWDLVIDEFPNASFIELPKAPLQSVTSVTYLDSAGDSQTWASTKYIVTNEQTLPVLNPKQPRGLVSLAYGKTWPSTYGQAGDITVRFVCGYGAASAVPSLLKAAMLLDLGALYSHRSNVVVGTSSTLFAVMPGGVRDIYWSCRSHATTRVAA